MAFRLNSAGVREMLNAPFLEAEMLTRANRVKVAAEATAPVGLASDPHAGRYKDSFHVSSGTDGGSSHDRAYGKVSNDAPEAVYVEFGNGHAGTAQHTLYRALGAA